MIRERTQLRVDRARIVWLTLGLVVSLGLTFALGYITGRRAERIEPDPPPADVITQIESDKKMHDELTFYARLDETAPEEAAAGRPSPPPVARPAPEPVAAVEPAPAATPSTAVEPKKNDLNRAVERVRRVAHKTDPAAVERALAAGPAQPGDFTVQVSAFQSLGEAKAYGSGLERKGFRPFIVTSTLPGRGTWYRVRIGRFDSEQTAEEAKTILAQAAIPAWVLRVE